MIDKIRKVITSNRRRMNQEGMFDLVYFENFPCMCGPHVSSTQMEIQTIQLITLGLISHAIPRKNSKYINATWFSYHLFYSKLYS